MAVRVLQGEALAMLKTLPDESVHCIVSSPPYWRQRDYGVAGQLGLEQTPEEYVDRLVAIFREARRVLRTDGTAWVNLGDKWASGGNGGGGSFMEERGEAWAHVKENKGWRNPPAGYKDKDLVGVPWMFAFAARADGWFLRQCNIWAKPNCMPESVQDRSTVEDHQRLATICGGFLSDKIKVYISGPYTKGDPVENTRKAILAGNEILSYGHVPIIPHLTMFWHLLTPRPWQDWINYDLELIPLCGIILRLPGDSTGADMEVAEAKKHGLVVVGSVEDAKHAIDVQYCRGGF